MNNQLLKRMKELSGILSEDNPSIDITGINKDIFGKDSIKIKIKFPRGDVYEEEYSASPFILNRFKYLTKFSKLKAYNYLKSRAKQEESKKITEDFFIKDFYKNDIHKLIYLYGEIEDIDINEKPEKLNHYIKLFNEIKNSFLIAKHFKRFDYKFLINSINHIENSLANIKKYWNNNIEIIQKSILTYIKQIKKLMIQIFNILIDTKILDKELLPEYIKNKL